MTIPKQFITQLVSVTILMSLIWQANANGRVAEFNFDSLTIGTAPDNFASAGEWWIRYTTDVAGQPHRWEDDESILSIVPRSSFEEGGRGNSLRIEAMDFASQASPIFEEPIHVEDADVVSLSLDVWIEGGNGESRTGPLVYLGHSEETGPDGRRLAVPMANRGPFLWWDKNGALQANANPNASFSQNMRNPRTLVESTPADESQNVRLDIDMQSNTYDVFWSEGGAAPTLVAGHVRFFRPQDVFDRIEIGALDSGLDFGVDYDEGVSYVDNVRIELLTRKPGDANYDGTVDFDDFLALSTSFGERGTWSQGDFDLNKRIEFEDFLILSKNFGSTTTAAVAVPEPTALSISLFCLLGLIGLRGKR